MERGFNFNSGLAQHNRPDTRDRLLPYDILYILHPTKYQYQRSYYMMVCSLHCAPARSLAHQGSSSPAVFYFLRSLYSYIRQDREKWR
jgi:hypothetical protein